MSAARVVVVGASLAGLRACEVLRQEGFDGTITLVGAEAEVPYDRPPLSKKVLAGEWEADRIRLRKADDFASLALDLRLGVAATALDTAARTVSLADGATVAYDGLVIATGAAPRKLPGQPDSPSIVTLRTLSESLALRERLADGHRLVVIGAGFIGLEVAATARQRGCTVTVLEGLPAPLVRGLGAELGTAVAAVHSRNGVDVRCGVQVVGLTVQGDGTVAVALGDGSTVAAATVVADTVVIGIGVAPALGWLEGSGLTVRDGLVCDETETKNCRPAPLCACSPRATAPAGRTARPRGRRRRPGGDARRALDERQRATARPRRTTCWPSCAASCGNRSCPCRSSGATSSTAASSSSVGHTATTTSMCSAATPPPAHSPRSTATAAACAACSGSAARSW